MPVDRRPITPGSGTGSLAPSGDIGKSLRPSGNRCGDCVFLWVQPYLQGDPPEYWCSNPRTKDLIPAIELVAGPEAQGCRYFVPAKALQGLPSKPTALGDVYLSHPDQFIDVATAASPENLQDGCAPPIG